ncbi:hypothetical protein PVAP13_3KG068200 [Panicum virgatum]|uniref:F-box domain-containing protein n=1 Tax=Panicum virgatum TaxID=38727 RepID=A0A8T0UNG2_PANVG|nr:hypothetical protein PVAP13_3KG068200 [Panicum virgatum]
MTTRFSSPSSHASPAAPLTSSGAPPPAGGGDLISDDLLVRVLELLPDARDAVRTHALSRRWRALWTRVAALRFHSDRRRWELREPGPPEQFVAFVDRALALRAAEKEPALEHLDISFDLSQHESEELVPPTIEAAQRWIRYAMQHEVKSLTCKVHLPWPHIDDDDDDNMTIITLGILSAELETMRLALSSLKLRLPSTAAFASLTDLSLESMVLEAGGAHLLARFVSSACCPRLHRLQLAAVMEMETLLIDAGALLELSLEDIDDMLFLQLRTPSLRVLHVKRCNELVELKVSAPRLEDIKFLVQNPLHIDGYLHDDDRNNDGSIRLLECCRLIRCLEICLEIVETMNRRKIMLWQQLEVDIIKGSIPQLPHVTSLKIHVTLGEGRSSYAAGIASLLAQCSSIRYLGLNFRYWKNDPELGLTRDNSAPSWESHELSLPHLQVAEFEKLMGTDDEHQFIQFILTRTTGIQKVAFGFDQKSGKKAAKMVVNLCHALAGVVHEWRPTVEIEVLRLNSLHHTC